MDVDTFDFLVLGGGLAGVTFATEAARGGNRVAVLESEDRVGGLCRTLTFGPYRFDIGGHRFHSPYPHIVEWVRDRMAEEMCAVPRQSRILLDGRYVDYPLRFFNALRSLSTLQIVHVCASYLWASMRRHDAGRDVSFEDWVTRRFGRALYDIYFRPYTEKVWGIPCTELSADWASQRIRLPSLTAAVQGSLLRGASPPGAMLSQFLYPSRGIGALPERIADRARATRRAVIHLNSRVERLTHGDGRWRVSYRQDDRDRTITGRQVVSTIPVDTLLSMLPWPDGSRPEGHTRLAYRGLICIFIAVDGPQVSSDTWTYFPAPDLTFGRTHEPSNWSSHMAPPGKTSICAEVFCSPGDETWCRSDDALIDAVVTELDSVGFLARERIDGAWMDRFPQAYPIYHIGYTDVMRRVRESLNQWPTLHLLGRTGSFQYLNMDGVIDQALRLAVALGGA